MHLPNFDTYAPRIFALPSHTPLTRADLLTDEFLLAREESVEMYFMPSADVDRRGHEAKLLLVGITPGWTQMELAYRHVRNALKAGDSVEAAREIAEQECSFAGTMRKNLVRMLDDIGVPGRLGIVTSEHLFASGNSAMVSTSALRHPVFVKGENYTGHSSVVLRTKMYQACLREIFVIDLNSAPKALIVPLGKFVNGIVRELCDTHLLDRERCLFSFPHPSGANGHRPREFAAARDELKAGVRRWFGNERGSRSAHRGGSTRSSALT